MEQTEVYKAIDLHYRDNAKTYSNRLVRFLRNRERAEDVVQEAYSRALTYWASFPGVEQIDRWMGLIVSRCVKDNQKEEGLHGMTSYTENDYLVGEAATPSIISQEIIEEIKKQPEELSQILTLVLLKQYRPKEAAHIMKKTSGAVRQIVFSFRKTMKEKHGVEL